MREWEREEQNVDPRELGSGDSLWPQLGCRITQRSLFVVTLCTEDWAACPWGQAVAAAWSRVSLALCHRGGFPVLDDTGELLLPI